MSGDGTNPQGGRARRIHGPALVVGVLAALVWLGQTAHFVFAMVATVPKYEEIFRDFGVALPVMSRWFISMSWDFRSANPGQSFSVLWVMVAMWIALELGAAIFCATRRSVWLGLVYLVLGMIWWGIFGLLLVVAMDMPMQSMIQSLQGGGI